MSVPDAVNLPLARAVAKKINGKLEPTSGALRVAEPERGIADYESLHDLLTEFAVFERDPGGMDVSIPQLHADAKAGWFGAVFYETARYDSTDAGS